MFYSKGGATFIYAHRTGICQGTFEIVHLEVLWSIWDLIKDWEVSLSQMLHDILGHALPNWTLLPILTLLQNF